MPQPNNTGDLGMAPHGVFKPGLLARYYPQMQGQAVQERQKEDHQAQLRLEAENDKLEGLSDAKAVHWRYSVHSGDESLKGRPDDGLFLVEKLVVEAAGMVLKAGKQATFDIYGRIKLDDLDSPVTELYDGHPCKARMGPLLGTARPDNFIDLADRVSKSDLVLSFGGRRRHVKRALLARGSDYFDRMFGGFWIESRLDVIELQVDEPEALDRVLAWMHGRPMTEITVLDTIIPDMAFEKFKLFAADYVVADKYLVSKLARMMITTFDAVAHDLWGCLLDARRLEEFVDLAYASVPDPQESLLIRTMAESFNTWLMDLEMANPNPRHRIRPSAWGRVMTSYAYYNFLEDLQIASSKLFTEWFPAEPVQQVSEDDLREEAKRICNAEQIWESNRSHWVPNFGVVRLRLPRTGDCVSLAYVVLPAPAQCITRWGKGHAVLHYDTDTSRSTEIVQRDWTVLRRVLVEGAGRSRFAVGGHPYTIHALLGDSTSPIEWARKIITLPRASISPNGVYFDVHGRIKPPGTWTQMDEAYDDDDVKPEWASIESARRSANHYALLQRRDSGVPITPGGTTPAGGNHRAAADTTQTPDKPSPPPASKNGSGCSIQGLFRAIIEGKDRHSAGALDEEDSYVEFWPEGEVLVSKSHVRAQKGASWDYELEPQSPERHADNSGRAWGSLS